MSTITIEIDPKVALARHIEDLQRVITKRNETIEQLRAQLDAGEGSPLITKAYEKGKREGWEACSNRLMSATHEAARLLGAVRHDAFNALLEGERAARAAGQASQDRSTGDDQN